MAGQTSRTATPEGAASIVTVTTIPRFTNCLTAYHTCDMLYTVKWGGRWGAAVCLATLLSSCTSSHKPAPPFEDVARETGLDFWHFSGATGDFRLREIAGSGGALIDYDNDGALDIFLVQGVPMDPEGKPLVPLPAGWKPGNRLFRNNLVRTGKLSFTDVTESAGLGYADIGMGVATGDYDNDGYTDLYVTNYGHNVLYHNNGNGTFTNVTETAGVESSGWSTSA